MAAPDDQRDRRLAIAEAVLLSLVALLAAWSGYAAAKFSTESRVSLARATSLHTRANRAQVEALVLRNFDSSTFNAWFAAYIARDEQATRVAEHRFRPAFAVAFRAWRRTKPETNPDAPPGPTYMPQYKEPGLGQARSLDNRANAAFARGESAGSTADKYVRLTVLLASILFLVGISTQFRVRDVRYALLGLSVGLLLISLAQIITLPHPPL
jgi:hypothetical protein